MEIAVFSYRIDDILKELYKRTSYMGKMRGTENIPNLIDRMSLSESERFLSNEFIDDAVEQTYDWLKAFGRGVTDSHTCIANYQDHEEFKDCGILFTTGDELTTRQDLNKNVELGCSYTSALNSVMVQNTNINVRCVTGAYGAKVNLYITYNFTIQDGSATFLKIIKNNISNQTIDDSHTLEHNTKTIKLSDIGVSSASEIVGITLTASVEIVSPLNTYNMSVGDFVEYHKDLQNLSDTELYRVTHDCNNTDWKLNSTLLNADIRGSITFQLAQPKFFDVNAISKVNRNIKEALLNYIIYRWYEYVKSDEAEAFYKKFEAYAHQAKISMNAEVSPMMRKSVTLN